MTGPCLYYIHIMSHMLVLFGRLQVIWSGALGFREFKPGCARGENDEGLGVWFTKFPKRCVCEAGDEVKRALTRMDSDPIKNDQQDQEALMKMRSLARPGVALRKCGSSAAATSSAWATAAPPRLLRR